MTRNFINEKRKLTKSEAGRLGGVATIIKHGNPGTPEGRRKGGIKSLKTHKKLGTKFRLRKQIRKPKYSKELAEFVGIMLGDGHVGKYQSSITTNAKTDAAHAFHISSLVKKLFQIEAPVRERRKSNAIEIVISSFEACRFFEQIGLKQGNKIINKVKVPFWILQKIEYIRSCVRGLFDTDGCIYLDKHSIRGKEYRHMGIAFANNNNNILSFFKKSLENAGLHPTQRSKNRVFLRRKSEVDLYFVTFSSSNVKHIERYKRFKNNVGRVA